jgi:hypothetical protein
MRSKTEFRVPCQDPDCEHRSCMYYRDGFDDGFRAGFSAGQDTAS